MKKFCLYDKTTGVIRSITQGEKPDMTYHPDMECIELKEDLPGVIIDDHQVVDGAVVRRTYDFEEQKRRKILAVVEHHSRGAHHEDCFIFNGHHYQIDNASRLRLDSFGARAANSIVDPFNFPWPENEYWIDEDNVHVPMTAKEAYAFYSAVGLFISASVKYQRELKDLILRATTQEELDAIDVTVGWPLACADG